MVGNKKLRGGGRLTRSETVTVRLDPKLNYLCELAARAERRTKSSYIEAMLDQKISETPIAPRSNEETIGDLADKLWHVDICKRFLAMVQYAPQLMTIEEQELWTIIEDSAFFWSIRHDWQNRTNDIVSADGDHYLLSAEVRRHWDIFLKIASGKLDKSALPPPTEVKVRFAEEYEIDQTNLDDDSPS